MRRSLLASVAAVLGLAAFAPTALSQSTTAEFTGDIAFDCTINAIQTGALAPATATSLRTISRARVDVFCNVGYDITVAPPVADVLNPTATSPTVELFSNATSGNRFTQIAGNGGVLTNLPAGTRSLFPSISATADGGNNLVAGFYRYTVDLTLTTN